MYVNIQHSTYPSIYTNLHTGAEPPSLCMISDTLHMQPRATVGTQGSPEHIQAIRSISYIECIPSSCQAGCQYVQLPSKQPRLLQIIKYAFKMSLGLQRAKAEATNRCTLVVQLTWLELPLFFYLFLSFFGSFSFVPLSVPFYLAAPLSPPRHLLFHFAVSVQTSTDLSTCPPPHAPLTLLCHLSSIFSPS